jgi:hypothetical protein
MQSVKYISPTVTDTAEKNIIDSAIGEDYGNSDVVAAADDHDHDAVVPADVIGDNDETISQILELAIASNSKLVVPVQKSANGEWYTSACETINVIEDHGLEDRVFSYAVGGVKDSSFTEQTAAVFDVREAIGPDSDLHLFGAGCSSQWALFLRANRDVLDSIDMSTPMRAPISGRYVIFNMSQIQTEMPRGTHSSFIKARMAESICTNINYILSDGPNEEEVAEILRNA